ncbi:tRNA threonylcarbamoyladenosine dehydratase [Halobacteriovorax marinus]|uniref:tRNA threonylcarbamoyladenosine dehydratase n=1 Tax=Halobacteriovorax marinus TaxID=97084 RepID=UPI000BC32F76|nr:tRNA threonylcarbamoyladenosine dehydratase [Halobacteriovorax marinus]ATH08457.1 tRNA threonylcarbamoyladenosine dehydratase [Halobacteriovorax marinus]
MTEENFRFTGISRLYGARSGKLLENSHICIIGLGGVGSWSAEALVRSGVGEITLVDLDDICITNVNRQLHALDGNIGKLKIRALEQRCLLINPEVKIHCIEDFLTADSVNEILSTKFDYVIDAIDSLDNKAILINEALKRSLPIITVGGAGGKQDATQIRVDDLSKSWNDRLLQKLRKKLRKDFDFPMDDSLFGVKSVFSPELPFLADEEGEVCQIRKDQQRSYRLDCYTGFGSATFVTGTFGFVAAGEVVKSICSRD